MLLNYILVGGLGGAFTTLLLIIDLDAITNVCYMVTSFESLGSIDVFHPKIVHRDKQILQKGDTIHCYNDSIRILARVKVGD
jgi:hypothetical protein